MTQNIVSIDGIYYNLSIPKDGITRNFEIADTDKAGRLQTGRMQRDIIGTYYNYTIIFNTSKMARDEYDRFYEQISAPVDSHILIVPYGQGTLEYEAYVTNGQDIMNRVDDFGNKWSGLSLNFIATEPQRRG